MISFNQTNLNQNNLRGLAEDFGRNWAGMVNRTNGWALSSGFSQQILFTGAIDIEWGQDSDGVYRWNTPYVTRGWTDAFDGNDNGTSVYFQLWRLYWLSNAPRLELEIQ